ncbi:glutathione S-transferase [Sphingomonas sp. Leaf17]|uniref:glutathione S-transferase n=1 Tax=Sphingomonas sp. Leaf17 TaxID=1735683 RepID=UPI0007009316|nr:glutathione S-transferase [Sphingomonas sp. Leaf17]KQM68121.1 glutathione S-transferase [Sphingomonas sp. Leaf17]
MTLPVLYSFRRCPYAMRARLAVLASGVRVEWREVVLRAKPAAMLAASPKATVPVLVLPDGYVIDQSLAIMRWALAQGDPAGWLRCDDPAAVAANDGAFKHHLDRYKYADRYGVDAVVHRQAALDLLAPVDDRLRGAPHLGGDRPGLADAAILPFVRQFAGVDPAWFGAQALAGVQGWLARFVASDAFARIMVRVPPWQPGDAPRLFPAD